MCKFYLGLEGVPVTVEQAEKIPVGTVRGALILISTTVPKVTPATNQRACEPFGLGTTPMSKPGGAWNNSRV